MLQHEFVELANTQYLKHVLERGLVRVNDHPISSLQQASTTNLKNMDTISRVVHWHEPPIHLPYERIGVHMVPLPKGILKNSSTSDDDESGPYIYVCDKPSTVPVHPAGPYLSNSLTMLVEAQEGLSPKSLIPCHRIDRVTSGLTLCCTDINVARLVQGTIDRGDAAKRYLAKVNGRFPTDPSGSNLPTCTDLAVWRWVLSHDNDGYSSDDGRNWLQVDAPIETVDPANGVRKITPNGKQSTSKFQLIDYHKDTDTSVIVCVPETGRSHQLRVHLQWLGYPIVNDVQYGTSAESSSLDTAAASSQSSVGADEMLKGASMKTAASSARSTVGVDEMLKEAQDEREPPPFASNIPAADQVSARQVCKTCTLGPTSAFTPAQLLQGGHSICLHAYRYSLTFPSLSGNDKTAGTSNAETEEVITIDVGVDLPSWASHLKKQSSGT
jgi:23S rRNA-/tRNA-specific pseudouridylate synthase